jgi:hypothetical protein
MPEIRRTTPARRRDRPGDRHHSRQQLTTLADDLRREGIELVLARDVASVRELVRLGDGEAPLRTYPTVRAAVAALQ